MSESDLYRPVADYLVAQGYSVQGEVRGCDLTATRADELVAVELKLRFGLSVIVQAVERQKAVDSVYIAVPRPKGGLRSPQLRSCLHLLRRLELGLILIDCTRDPAAVEITLHPVAFDRAASIRRGRRIRRSIIREMEGRSGDYNIGGSTRKKIVTAYRESAIHIACCMQRFGTLSPKRLRELGAGPKTQSILTKNHYGWFVRESYGRYGLSDAGRNSLREFSEVAAQHHAVIDEIIARQECAASESSTPAPGL